MQQGQLISVGSINIDLQSRVARWPQPGETLIGRDLIRTGGGKAANVAFVARRLGVESKLIANVGVDADQALAGLRSIGVDLHDVQQVPGLATGLAMIFVRSDGEKSIVLVPNANDAWRQERADSIAGAIQRAPVGSVLVTDLEVPQFIVERAMRAARDRGFKVILDPSPAEHLPPSILPLADCITPNQPEAAQLSGRTVQSHQEAFEVGWMLIERGVDTAFIKLATGACVVVNRERRAVVTGFRVDVVDKTGAGDAFAGALGVALLERMPLERAARFAVAAANFAVTRYGSQPAYPARGELEQLIESRTGGG